MWKIDFDLLSRKIPMKMEEKNLSAVTDFKQASLFLSSNETRLVGNETKGLNLLYINLLECILKEIKFIETKDHKVLEELHINSLITKYYREDAPLITVMNFIKETKNWSIPVYNNSDEVTSMYEFKKKLVEIINSYALDLSLEIEHGHLKNMDKIIDMQVEQISYESSEASVR